MERKIMAYEAALDALDGLAQTQSFHGPAGFYGWQRLQGLHVALRGAFDAYELEGDAEPARRAIEAYHEDLVTHQVRQDLAVHGVLERLLAAFLDQGLELRIATSQQDPGIPSTWSATTLTVTAEALDALAREARGTKPV